MNWHTALEVIGWVGSALVVISLMLSRVLRFRWMNLIGSLIATVYNAILGIWPFFAMNFAIVIINAIWLWRIYRTRYDDATYQVVEVDPMDAYLLHLQTSNAEDIAKYAPEFNPRVGVGERRLAFIVVKGTETVGLVEVRDAGLGVGEVLLDWVLPRYRDFTPGEFVYRDSGVFAKAGFRQLRRSAYLPPDAKYLTRIGFVERDGVWTYDVPQVGATPDRAAPQS